MARRPPRVGHELEAGVTERTVERTVHRLPASEDPAAQKIRAAVPDISKITLEGYYAALCLVEVDTPLEFHVFKRLRNMSMLSKVGVLAPNEVEPESLEPFIVQSWGPGAYQLRPVVNRMYYAPSSPLTRVGDERPDESGPAPVRTSPADVDAAIAEASDRLGRIAAVEKFKAVLGSDKKEGEVDAARVQEMITASQAPVLQMLQMERERAARLEERNERLMEKLLDSRSQSTQSPVMGEVLRALVGNPDALAMVLGKEMAAAPTSTGWLDVIREAISELKPALGPIAQAFAVNLMQRSSAPARPAPSLAYPASPATPPPLAGRAAKPVDPDMRPTGTHAPASVDAPQTEGTDVPMELNEEQALAKENLLRFMKANDMANAFGVLESFPGFFPLPNGGAMPLGEAIISRIDPALHPSIYVPQLMMFAPELRDQHALAEAFIAYVQKRLLEADEDDARAKGGSHA